MRKLTLPLIVALIASAAIVPAAGAHGEEELGGEVAEGRSGGHVVGYGRFTTTRRHHRLYVRVCIQRWRRGHRWRTQECERAVARRARTKTQAVNVRCSRDGIYRVRVWGRTKSRDGKAGHRVQGKSQGYGIDCNR